MLANLPGVIPGRASTRAALHLGRGRDDGDEVARFRPAALEQQRNIEDDERAAAVAGEEPPPRRRDQRMNDRLQPVQRGIVAEHRRPERRPVEDAVDDDPRKRRRDRRQRRPARGLERMDRGVGVEHRHMATPEHRRDGRLAHADRAGETKDDHAAKMNK